MADNHMGDGGMDEGGGHHVLMNQGQIYVGLTAPSLAIITGQFDADGERVTFDEAFDPDGPGPLEADGVSQTALQFDIKAAYGIIDGLEAGLVLPIVSNSLGGTVAGTDLDSSGFGLGDVALYGAYEARLSALDVGGGAYFKLATGKSDDLEADELPTGSGQMDLGVGVFARKVLGKIQIDGKVGYIVTMASEEDILGTTVDINPGDILYLDVGGTYWITDQLSAGLYVVFFSGGEVQVDGDAADDSSSNLLSIAPAVNYHVNDMIDLGLSTRFRRHGAGPMELRSGIPLTGKNESFGVAIVTLDLNVRFGGK
jgi:hypothetical protein